MDTKKIAEKIALQAKAVKDDADVLYFASHVQEQIEKAVREAVKRINYIDMTPATKFVYEMAFHAAREKAAGIADSHERFAIARLIRATEDK